MALTEQEEAWWQARHVALDVVTQEAERARVFLGILRAGANNDLFGDAITPVMKQAAVAQWQAKRDAVKAVAALIP